MSCYFIVDVYIDENKGRVIIIRFPSREKLDACFASEEYRHLMHERVDNVDARALIVEGETLIRNGRKKTGKCSL